mgnify:CR=1 FL=1
MLLGTPSPSFTNQTKGSSSSTPRNGTYFGVVVRTSGGVYVKVPKLAPGTIFGPCKQFFQTTVSVDDIVLCTFIDNKFDELVLLGTTASPEVTPSEGVTQQDLANAIRDLKLASMMDVI